MHDLSSDPWHELTSGKPASFDGQNWSDVCMRAGEDEGVEEGKTVVGICLGEIDDCGCVNKECTLTLPELMERLEEVRKEFSNDPGEPKFFAGVRVS